MNNYIGIDLAGSPKRPSGICILDEEMNAQTFIVYSDEEIIKIVKDVKPLVIAIDAPLFLPKGRKSLSERGDVHLRSCDRELLKMGIKFFPITLGPMRMLTERGIKLRAILEGLGYKVIETYPGAAQDILKIPRKKDPVGLENGLVKIGIKIKKSNLSNDELDAITCALVAKMYFENKYSALGVPDEGYMILPLIDNIKK
jgi:predicted nuclease with RNAse H fold